MVLFHMLDTISLHIHRLQAPRVVLRDDGSYQKPLPSISSFPFVRVFNSKSISPKEGGGKELEESVLRAHDKL